MYLHLYIVLYIEYSDPILLVKCSWVLKYSGQFDTRWQFRSNASLRISSTITNKACTFVLKFAYVSEVVLFSWPIIPVWTGSITKSCLLFTCFVWHTSLAGNPLSHSIGRVLFLWTEVSSCLMPVSLDTLRSHTIFRLASEREKYSAFALLNDTRFSTRFVTTTGSQSYFISMPVDVFILHWLLQNNWHQYGHLVNHLSQDPKSSPYWPGLLGIIVRVALRSSDSKLTRHLRSRSAGCYAQMWAVIQVQIHETTHYCPALLACRFLQFGCLFRNVRVVSKNDSRRFYRMNSMLIQSSQY